MTTLAFNLLKRYPDLYITIAIHICAVVAVEKEIARMNAPETSRGRFRIQSLGYDSPSDPFTLIDEQEESLRSYFDLLAGSGIGPSLVVSDVS